MKKTAVLAFLAFFLTSPVLHAATESRTFQGRGMVVSVDPVYSQISILHGAIKDFAGDETTQFFVSGPELLQGISKNDLVEFEFADNKGDVRITKITKTGVAPAQEPGVPLGDAVQGTLQGVGAVAQGVTSPLPAVSDAIGGATGSASDATDPRIIDGEVKQKIATF